jgi:hypothetical protein
MPIRMSEVKALCTSSELELVQASRKPKLEALSLAEAKRYAQRARKLFDKWQDQARRQARAKTRTVGLADLESRSHQKEQIFQEALGAFEAQVAKLGQSPSAGRGKVSAGVPKKARAAKHRATLAVVRAELAEAEAVLNAERRAVTTKAKPSASTEKMGRAATAKAAKPKSADEPKVLATPSTQRGKTEPAKASAAVASGGAKAKRGPVPPTTRAQKISTTKSKQRSIGAKVKKTLLKISGKTTRILGHTEARGKRKQARRDQRG